MKLRVDQLLSSLNKPLSPIYLLSGSEALQLQEAASQIRAAAKKQGFSERQIHEVNKTFDWDSFSQSLNILSLFSEKTLVELRFTPQNKSLGIKGSKALLSIIDNLPSDKVLLIMMDKLDQSSQKTKWFKAVDNAGVIVQVWPVDRQRLPQWIQQRIQSLGMRASIEAIQLLADKSEGNLLALAQEIEKLSLIDNGSIISLEDMEQSICDSARYDLFGFVDVVLQANIARFLTMLKGLRAEGVEAILVLWALTREIRLLSRCSEGISQGISLNTIFEQEKIWEKRRPILSVAVKRLPLCRWQACFITASHIDQAIKGVKKLDVWDQITALCFMMMGCQAFPSCQASGWMASDAK